MGGKRSAELPRGDDSKKLLRDSVRSLRDLALVSEIQTEIMRHLVEGPRTVPELVALIFGTGRNGLGFPACYMKIKRSIRKLENKALVSTNLLGRDKPYRLTRFAVEKLYCVGRPGMEPEGLVPKKDLVLYTATLLCGVTAILLTWASPTPPEPGWILVSTGAFLYLLGLATSRILRGMRRII